MREAVETKNQLALLKRFKDIGGCVDYVILDCDVAAEDDVASGETHRKAAIIALEIIGRRFAQYAAEMSKLHGLPIKKFSSITIDFERANCLAGERVSLDEFLGPRYDLLRKRLIMPRSGVIPGGYAFAFSDPPYTLADHANNRRISEDEASDLFHAINVEVLSGVSPDSVIFQWPDDWSNYFDSGKEWWGSFLWTFANPGVTRIIALGASTTD
jgi:hypothetical protein